MYQLFEESELGMAFKYDPKNISNCLEKGDYDAELGGVEETVSQKGSPMLKVVWSVFANGERRRIPDYIVAGTAFKLKNIAIAWGKLAEFEEEDPDRRFDLAKYIGKQIVVKLGVQSREGFADSNTIISYASAGGRQPLAAEPQPPTVGDAHEGPAEHIPF